MIHPSHQTELRQAGYWLLGLLAGLSLLLVLPAPHEARGLSGYLPLHTAMEVLAIAVAAMVFGISWATQQYRPDGRVMLIGVAFLGVALLDFSHALSYTGMPDFVTPSGPEKGINFWLAARLLAALALLSMAWWPSGWAGWLTQRSRYGALLGVLSVVAMAHYVFLFHPERVPNTFIAGQGLTPFKVRFEYGLIALYLLAGLGFLWHVREPRAFGASRLALACFTMAMSEYFFTLYANVTDVYNVMGHVYKVVAYGFLYRALFVETVQHPYQALLKAEARQRATLETLPDLLFEVDRRGTYLSAYAQEMDKLSAPVEQLIGRTVADMLPPEAAQTCLEVIEQAEREGRSRGRRIAIELPQGVRYFELSAARKPAVEGGAPTYLVLSRDVTAAVTHEHRMSFEARLNAALLAVQQQSSAHGEDAWAQQVAQWARRLTDSREAFVRFVQEDPNRPGHWVVVPGPWAKPVHEAPFPCVAGDAWRQAIESRQPLLLNDVGHAAHMPEAAATTGRCCQRLLCVPVRDASGSGLLLAVMDKARPYDAQDVEAVQALAEALWKQLKDQRQQATIHRLSEALDQSPYPVLITDVNADIVYVNAAFTQVSGYSAEEVLGKNPRLLQSGSTPRATYDAMWSQLTQGLPWQGEFINRRKDGSLYIEHASLYPIMDPSGQLTHYVAHKEDITQRREAEARLRALSDFDPLTGLLNKKSFDEHLERALHQARQDRQRLTLAWIDLDNFKAVNDSLGHLAGDELLVEMGKRLREAFAPPCEVARHSGDAFVVILPEVDQATAAIQLKNALTAVQETLTIQDSLLSIGASAGLAVFPDDAQTAAGLASAAEVAMYRVKDEGRNGMRFYSADMQATTQRSLELAAGLKVAVECGELYLLYQPQCSLHTDELLGAEALLRWKHPKWGIVSPAEFIPIAEQTGLIVPIGAWVVSEVARQLRRWDEAGLPPLTVSVNVSAVQFVRPEFVPELLATVQGAGVPPQRIELELTEAVALKAPQQAAVVMQRLHEAGFKVALDDFGTGYSSMSYLKRYAIDKLKIDQSFVRELADSPSDQAIVRAIVQLAHTLGLRTIAEGVETAQQAQVLASCGCDDVQGYWYSRPLEAAVLEQFVRQRQRA
jgi:diguanylate cyclase (GGDEF)-like protein/PAS domain S-box-containing protein